MAISTDKQLARRKNVQAGLSGASAALGVGALTAMGVKTGAGKLVRAGSKSGVLRRPVSVDNLRRRADKVTQGLTVGSVGVGGLSSANFASVQRAESKKIKKNEGYTMDFGLGNVRQGEISKAMSQEMKEGRRANRKVMQEHTQRGINQGMATGALVGGAGLALAGSKPLRWGVRATGRLMRQGAKPGEAIRGGKKMRDAAMSQRFFPPPTSVNTLAGATLGSSLGIGVGGAIGRKRATKDPRWDSRYPIGKALFPSGPVTRKVVDSGAFAARSTMSPRAGASYLNQRTTEIGRKDGALWRAKKVTVTANRMESAPGGTATAAGSFAGTSVSRTRGGPTALGAGVGAGIGAGGAGYAAGRKNRVSKAFDAERSRRKRLTAYSHGAAAAGGAAGLAGGRLIAVGAKDLKNAKTLPKFKAAQAKTGKGVALTAGAVGAGIAANRINEFKYRGGGSYRPRYINQ